MTSGARGTRTPDLLGAIQALSQLSYSPGWPPSVARVRVPRGSGRSARRGRGYRPRTNTHELSQPADAVLRPHRRRPDGGGGVRPLPAHRRQRERQGRRAPGRPPTGRRSTSTARTTTAPSVAAAKIGGDVALAQALRTNDRQALQARLDDLLKQERVRRIVVARGSRAIADAGSRDRRLPGGARPRRPRQPAFGTLQVSVQEPATYTGLVSRVTGSGAVVQRVGGPVLASSVKGVDPGLDPLRPRRARGRRQALRRRLVHGARLPRRDRPRRRAGAQGDGVHGRAQRPPAGGRHPGRLLHPRLHLRAAGLALAAAPDRRLPAGRAAPGLGRLHRRGPDRGPRRVRRAGRGVQQDVAPAGGAPGGAQPGARPPAGRDAPHRRDVRRQPRPRGPAGDRGQDRGRRRRAPTPAAPRCGPTPARRWSRSRSPGRSTGSRRPCAPPRRRCSRPASRARRPSTASARCRTRCAAATTSTRACRASSRWRAAAGRSASPSASSSTTSPARPRCRSRTSACTRRSSARR